MKTKESEWKKKVPKVRVVKTLGNIKDSPSLQVKLDKLNEIIRVAGLPKIEGES